MAEVTEFAELGVTSTYFDWWEEVSRWGDSIFVEVDAPEESEGSGETIVRWLAPASIHESFAALKDKYLCCGEAMAEEGYGSGCAQDADLVLQHAMFGRIVYG